MCQTFTGFNSYWHSIPNTHYKSVCFRNGMEAKLLPCTCTCTPVHVWAFVMRDCMVLKGLIFSVSGNRTCQYLGKSVCAESAIYTYQPVTETAVLNGELVMLTDFNESQSAACVWNRSDRSLVSEDFKPTACPGKPDVKSGYSRLQTFFCGSTNSSHFTADVLCILWHFSNV